MTEEELKQYEINKKYEVSQNMAEKKMQMSANIFVGNESLINISLLAEKFSKAGDMIPKDFQGKPDKCFAAIYKGASLGLDAFTSLQRIAVINGRATIWGDTALALVRKSGLMTKFKEEIIEEGGKLKAVCIVKRKDEEEHISEFTQEDAIKAGLWNQNTWAKHPKRMLKYRARAFALRDIFADVLDGLYLKEEMEGEMINVTPTKPASTNNNSFFQNQLNQAAKSQNKSNQIKKELPTLFDVAQEIPPKEELEKQNDLNSFFDLAKRTLKDNSLEDKRAFFKDKDKEIKQLRQDQQQELAFLLEA